MNGYGTMDKGSAEKAYGLLSRKVISQVSLFSTAALTVILFKIDAELAGFGGKGLFYLQTAFSKGSFAAVLSSWKSGGIDLLLDSLWLYYLYAASYAVLFSSAMAYFSSARRVLVPAAVGMSDLAVCLIPFAAALVDCTGLILLQTIFSVADLKEYMVLALSIVSSIKWALVALSLVLVLKSYFSFRKAMKGSPPGAS